MFPTPRGPWHVCAGLSILALLAAFARTANAAHSQWLAGFKNPRDFGRTIDHLDRDNSAIDAVLVTAAGEWLVAAGKTVKASAKFPSSLTADVRAKTEKGVRVVGGDCNEHGACVVAFEDYTSSAANAARAPSCFSTTLEKYKKNSWSISDIDITNNGCVFVGANAPTTFSPNLERELGRALADTETGHRHIEALALGKTHGWAMVANHNPMYHDAPAGLQNTLRFRSRGDRKAALIVIGPGSSYLWYSQRDERTSGSAVAPFGAIEWELGGKSSIWRRMNELGVTGVSVATISHGPSGFTVVGRGYGRRRADRDLPILARTPFALASMSKLLGAIVVAGQIESDPDVNGDTDLLEATLLPPKGAIRRWKDLGENPNSKFRQNLPDEMGTGDTLAKLRGPLSLDCIMTHQCGIVSVNDGSSLVRKGLWNKNNNRSTLDWMLGRLCDDDECEPFGNPIWQVDTKRGTFDYDSADYLLAQAYLEDRTGQSAHFQLAEKLFKPVGMPDSHSHIELSLTDQTDFAWRHTDVDTPDFDMASSAWVFGGGIWSSSVDYANAMIVLLNDGVAANKTVVLKRATVNTRFLNEPGHSGAKRGWGVVFNDVPSAADGTDEAFSHAGGQPGTRTKMCGNATDKEGIVVLTNLGGDDAATLINEIIAAYLSKVNWKPGTKCKS